MFSRHLQAGIHVVPDHESARQYAEREQGVDAHFAPFHHQPVSADALLYGRFYIQVLTRSVVPHTLPMSQIIRAAGTKRNNDSELIRMSQS